MINIKFGGVVNTEMVIKMMSEAYYDWFNQLRAGEMLTFSLMSSVLKDCGGNGLQIF